MKNTIVLKCIIPLLLLNLIGFAQTPTFSSNFEDQNKIPEIGKTLEEHGTSGNMWIAPNPHPYAINSSNYVLRVVTNTGTGGRAEYSAGRYETNEKKYIYTWKRFHPTDMFTDVNVQWMCINQWKTWPCETNGTGDYAIYGDLISYPGGGIFNENRFVNTTEYEYISRAEPCRCANFYELKTGYWHKFVLEIYWTNTEDGYYRLWKNDTLIGYSDHMKTLFDEFLEGTCDIYWSNGLYTYWEKTGGETQDSLIAYIDDIALYDIDSGYTISDICPDCEVAPATPTDSSVYKINLHGGHAADGYNNYMTSWKYDTTAIDVSNTFGQSSDIDVYIWSDYSMGTGSYNDECFPISVINPAINWTDAKTRHMYLKDLKPSNTYTVKVLAAGGYSSTSGTQIWTTEENRDTVFSAGNTCDMAEITDLSSDGNGDLTINVQTINGSTGYINAIEIVEYKVNNINSIKNTESNKLNIFPNPVNDNLFVMGEKVPSNITIYSYDGRKVKYAENTNIVNISDLKKGIYIVLVNMQESFVTIKIIKE